MNRKAFPAQFKAVEATDQDEGVFEAIVSVFGNIDAVNDRVLKGAFTKSIEKWSQSGDPLPVVFSHQWDNLDAHVGEVVEAEERDEGLWVKAQLDMEDEFARKLWNKMKRRRIKEFSFAYDIVEERQAKDGANELVELDLIEVGPTLKGVNSETQLLSVKGDVPWSKLNLSEEDGLKLEEIFKQKSGRILSKKNEETLRQAYNLIGNVLEQLTANSGDGNSDPEKADEPDGVKADEPRGPLAVRLTLAELDAL